MSDWPLRDVRVNARRKKTRGGKKIYSYIRGRWQICWICLDRSVLIVLTIIDRSFCRRRKKNACSPEHRSPPRDRYIIGLYQYILWWRGRDRRSVIGGERRALLQDSKLAMDTFFMCFFSFVLYTHISIIWLDSYFVCRVFVSDAAEARTIFRVKKNH